MPAAPRHSQNRASALPFAPVRPSPDISSADALKKSILAAKSIAYSAGASGTYIVSILEKLGINDQVKSKVATVKPSEPVGEAVARGDAEMGFHQVSELLPVKGIEFLGPLPADLQNITVYSGGIHTGTKEAAAAGELVKFLTAPTVAPTLKKQAWSQVNRFAQLFDATSPVKPCPARPVVRRFPGLVSVNVHPWIASPFICSVPNLFRYAAKILRENNNRERYNYC